MSTSNGPSTSRERRPWLNSPRKDDENVEHGGCGVHNECVKLAEALVKLAKGQGSLRDEHVKLSGPW